MCKRPCTTGVLIYAILQPMSTQNRVKIVCTIGPASQSRSTLEQMIHAGMDVARLNFSHGSYTDHAKLIRTIRTAAKKTGRTVAILQDLQGPRIRTGEVPQQGIELRNGTSVTLVNQQQYNTAARSVKNKRDTFIPIQYANLAHRVHAGDTITIQDGLIVLQVQRAVAQTIVCRVVQGGMVYSHKGMNVPGVDIDVPVITSKDRKDLAFGVRQGVDYVALSFVRDAQDVQHLRRLLPRRSGIKIIPKIERKQAVEHLDDIIEAANAVMVARGDLGIEIGTASVPLLQKDIVLRCLRAAKPVIVATQMLESMVTSPRPTRAEAADVANAIIDHTDAIMLSAESATGKFPVKAVQTMTSIAREVEPSPTDDLPEDIIDHRRETTRAGAAHAAVELAESTQAHAIVILTATGEEARLVAQLRPQQQRIIALTANEQTQRQLALVWGVESIQLRLLPTVNNAHTSILRTLRSKKLVARNSRVVIFARGRVESATL